MLGFAVLHAITRGIERRGLFMLGGDLCRGPRLRLAGAALCLLGLADTVFDLRAPRRAQPPAADP